VKQIVESFVPSVLLDAVAAPTPTPGGGSVAALAGALAAALVQMQAGLTVGKPAYAAVEPEMREILQQAESLRGSLAEAAQQDSDAYDAVMQAFAMPKSSVEDKTARSVAIEKAMIHAAAVPIRTARLSVDVLGLARLVAEKGNASCVCDSGVASYMAVAALKGALLNVEINARDIKNPGVVATLRAESAVLRKKGAALAEEIDQAIAKRLA
jgi:glutamate formiminotransferase/formiminotetrahydrofolate cyclodeaminase